MPRKKLFLSSFLFVNDLGSVEERVQHCAVGTETIVQWDKWLRDIIVESFLDNKNPCKVGEPNRFLQMDEVYVVKRKYNLGRIVRNSWMVGGTIQNTKEMFVEITS